MSSNNSTTSGAFTLGTIADPSSGSTLSVDSTTWTTNSIEDLWPSPDKEYDTELVEDIVRLCTDKKTLALWLTSDSKRIRKTAELVSRRLKEEDEQV